jgi:hypothetical protein
MGVLAGLTTYGISSGLIILGITAEFIPEDLHFPLILIWAIAGLGLAYIGVLRGKSN